jgi:hypothetical protein
MKFNYLATILMGTVALASNFNAGPANAIDCEPLYVPWKWQLTKSGTSNIALRVENKDPSFTRLSDSKELAVVYTAKLLFDEPSDYCEKLGNAPTETTLKIVGSFTGLLSSNFFSIPNPGLDGLFARASASVEILPAFMPEELKTAGSYEIDQTSATVRSVRDGDRISFAGTLNAFAYNGLDFGNGFSLASAHLDVNGAFIEETSGWVQYTVPVPEPLTILGSATGVGFAAFFKRKHSKKQKKS